MHNQIIFKNGNSVDNPTQPWAMQANSTVITSGQPAIQGSAPYVVAAPDASPVVGTHVFMGFSVGSSSQTTTEDGIANLYIPLPFQALLLPAKNAAAIATQSEYDALVFSHVLFDLTSGAYTVDTAVAASGNGLMILPLEISSYPSGLVCFMVRQSATYLN